MIKYFIISLFFIFNIVTFANEQEVKDARVLYIVQEATKDIIKKIENSNIKNKEKILKGLKNISTLRDNSNNNSLTQMQMSQSSRTYTKNNKIVKIDKTWVDKKMILGKKAFEIDDSQLLHSIKYQLAVFSVYFYLDRAPNHSGDIEKNKDFKYISKILDFNPQYNPQIKKYKGESPLEDARVLYYFRNIHKEVINKVKHSNIKNKEEILNDLANIDVYTVPQNNKNYYADIKMGVNTYGNAQNSQKKWVDKRVVFTPKSLTLDQQGLTFNINLQFSRFLYYFYVGEESKGDFDKKTYKYLCDIMDFDPNYKYITPTYPNETIVEDARVLYYMDLVHKDVVNKILSSNLKDKEEIVEQLKNIKAYKTKNNGNKVAEMVMSKKSYSASSADGKKTFHSKIWEEKRILFRENAFDLNDEALQNTMKHEFAHAIVGFHFPYEPKDAHGKEFKEMCELIGLDPRYSQAVVPMTEDDLY